MITVDLKYLKAVNDVFKRLNNMRRWTSFTTEGKYDELSKQSLNCMIADWIACFCEQEGQAIYRNRFPKIALYRSFQKAYVYFDVPEYILDEICQIGNIEKNEFEKVTVDFVREETDEEFAEFICEGLGTYEMRIYRAATKIATLVELEENRFRMQDNDDYDTKKDEIRDYLMNFLDIPGVKKLQDTKGMLFKLLIQISKLRNQNRWAVQSYMAECSVLGHLFDTAIYGYFIGLEKYQEETKATKLFWWGLCHDVPETWTKDIPSPIKRKIPGFREAVKKYEDKVMELKFYSHLPDFISDKIRERLLEEEENPDLRKLMKGADYLSADSECWRQYISGSRDEYFFDTAIQNFDNELEEGKYELPLTCTLLHQYFYDYAQSSLKK